MFEQQSTIRAAQGRVTDLRHRAQHHAVVKAILTERRQRLKEAALLALRSDLADMETRAATAWHLLIGHVRDA
ncbi:MAG TPA: hypothetical protein VFN07_11145 [Trueperaceae bacterium]|nr:hypothetical protein [Trueperaceae bacterium]